MDRKLMKIHPPFALVGLGAVGRSLAARLKEAGVDRLTLIGRNRARDRSFARKLAATLLPDVSYLEEFQGIIVLAVRDNQIAGVARKLARLPLNWKNITVIHTSGAQDSSVLEPLKKRGAGGAAWHPYQTFPKSTREAARLMGVTFGIDGNPRGVRAAFRLARLLGCKPVRISPEMRVLYHVSAVFASGFVAGNLAAAEAILKRVGLSPNRAREAVLAIARETLDNCARLGPHKAETGPAVRGDFQTVKKHTAALKKTLPELARTYQTISQRKRRRS